MYSMDDFVNDIFFFHNQLVGNPLPLDQGVNNSHTSLFPLSLIKLTMVAACWFCSVRNLVPIFPGSAQSMILTTELLRYAKTKMSRLALSICLCITGKFICDGKWLPKTH